MKEFDISRDYFGPIRNKSCGEKIVDGVLVCRSRTIPGEFDYIAPASEVFPSVVLIVQVIQHGTVVVAHVLVNCSQHLRRVGEVEHITDIHRLVDVLGAIGQAVLGHAAILNRMWPRWRQVVT